MNQISLSAVAESYGDTTATMTSLEISELTGKRHDNVMADIRKMLAELHGDGGVLIFQDTHTNTQNGQSYSIFKLPKRESLILVSGYSVTMRAKIIDRWDELETGRAIPAMAQPQQTIEADKPDPQAFAVVQCLTLALQGFNPPMRSEQSHFLRLSKSKPWYNIRAVVRLSGVEPGRSRTQTWRYAYRGAKFWPVPPL